MERSRLPILFLAMFLGGPFTFAKTKNEQLVSHHSTLAKLEAEMKQTIKALKNSYSPADQREWLQLSKGWCTQDDKKGRAKCLERSLQSRIRQMKEPQAFPYLDLYHDYAPHLVVKDSRIVRALQKLVGAQFNRLVTNYERMTPGEKEADGFGAFLFRGWVEGDSQRGTDLLLSEDGRAWVILAEGATWDYFTTERESRIFPATFTNAAVKWKAQYGEEVKFKVH